MMMKKAKKTIVLTAVVVGIFLTSFTGVMAHDEITPTGKPGYVHSD